MIRPRDQNGPRKIGESISDLACSCGEQRQRRQQNYGKLLNTLRYIETSHGCFLRNLSEWKSWYGKSPFIVCVLLAILNPTSFVMLLRSARLLILLRHLFHETMTTEFYAFIAVKERYNRLYEATD